MSNIYLVSKAGSRGRDQFIGINIVERGDKKAGVRERLAVAAHLSKTPSLWPCARRDTHGPVVGVHVKFVYDPSADVARIFVRYSANCSRNAHIGIKQEGTESTKIIEGAGFKVIKDEQN